MPTQRAFADVGGASDVGRIRKSNQDAMAWNTARTALVVCDGVGGHPAGDVAANAAAAAALAAMKRGLGPLAVKAADRAVSLASHRKGGHPQMATTIVACWTDRTGATISWAGDSRAYLLRRRSNGELRLVQLTADQGVGHMLSNGLGAGMPGHARAETVHVPLLRGNVIMICSDGIHGVVPSHEIKRALELTGCGAQTAANALVYAALKHGAPDNATAVVAVW